MQGAEVDPAQPDHPVAKMGQHAPHLSFAPLVNFDLQVVASPVCPAWGGGAVVQGKAISQSLQIGLDDRLVEAAVIGFPALVRRVQQSLGKLAIVGKEQQACAVAVEAAHGKQSGQSGGQELHDSGAALRIRGGGHVAVRLMYHPVSQGFWGGDVTLVYLYSVMPGFDTLPEVSRLSIDQYAAALDQALTGPARPHP